MKYLLSIALLFICYSISAQDTTGLIAHWKFSGNYQDTTGHGHDGTGFNVVPATGKSGIPNTACYFNGVNSYVSVPYASSLNLVNYSICATINVKGFYAGLCQANTVITRGRYPSAGCYSIVFMDNAYNDCSTLDTTKEVFYNPAGPNSVPDVDWATSPNIQENHWYSIVAMYDGAYFILYVDGVLIKHIAAPLPLGTSTDGISIGVDLLEVSAGYPYYFKGVIDDIMIYNRVLSDSEVIVYGATDCGMIATQPSNDSVVSTSNAKFFVTSTMPSATYQWQEKSGSMFVNLPNVPPYSGVNTDTLTIATSVSLDSTIYRCVVSNSSCADTTTNAVLKILPNSGFKNVISADMILVSPNPGHNQITVQLPGNGYGTIQLINEIGQVVLQHVIDSNRPHMDISTLPVGIYILKVQYDGGTLYKRVIKE